MTLADWDRLKSKLCWELYLSMDALEGLLLINWDCWAEAYVRLKP